jgi:hypothetical protein
MEQLLKMPIVGNNGCFVGGENLLVDNKKEILIKLSTPVCSRFQWSVHWKMVTLQPPFCILTHLASRLGLEQKSCPHNV